jgi:glutamate:Na+ symporter, ESS family
MVGFALVLVGVLLLVGKLMRVKIKPAQSLFLPSSVLAGFVALRSALVWSAG